MFAICSSRRYERHATHTYVYTYATHTYVFTYIHTGQETQREQVNFTTASVEEDIRAAAQYRNNMGPPSRSERRGRRMGQQQGTGTRGGAKWEGERGAAE